MITNINILNKKTVNQKHRPFKQLSSVSTWCLFQRCMSSLILGHLLVLITEQDETLFGHLCQCGEHIWQNLLPFMFKNPQYNRIVWLLT